MPQSTSQGQADKAAAERKTAEVAAENERTRDEQTRDETELTEAQRQARADADPDAPNRVDPYPSYDMMTLEDLRALAARRGVEINRDVERAHLITELRAADSGGLSVPARRGAR
jgi:hypothetical protein